MIRPDLTLTFERGEHVFKVHSTRGNEFLRKTFAKITGDVSPSGMIAIADKARMAGLVVAE